MMVCCLRRCNGIGHGHYYRYVTLSNRAVSPKENKKEISILLYVFCHFIV